MACHGPSLTRSCLSRQRKTVRIKTKSPPTIPQRISKKPIKQIAINEHDKTIKTNRTAKKQIRFRELQLKPTQTKIAKIKTILIIKYG